MAAGGGQSIQDSTGGFPSIVSCRRSSAWCGRFYCHCFCATALRGRNSEEGQSAITQAEVILAAARRELASTCDEATLPAIGVPSPPPGTAARRPAEAKFPYVAPYVPAQERWAPDPLRRQVTTTTKTFDFFLAPPAIWDALPWGGGILSTADTSEPALTVQHSTAP